MSVFDFLAKKANPNAPVLPMRARLGSRLAVQSSAFIAADISGSVFNSDENFGVAISSISTVKFDGMDQKVYRFYTSNGDQDTNESFIEFFMKPDQTVPTEIMLCKKLTRLYPESSEEQDMYMGKCSPDGLGAKFYSIDRQQLADAGYSETKLNSIFGNDTEIEYTRDVDNAVEFIDPFHGYETRIDSENGEEGLKQELFYMTYVRELQNDIKEFLIISTEVVKSQNGEDGNCLEIHVDFMFGLLVSPEKVEVQ